MINRADLLSDLKTVLRRLEADLLARSEEMPEVKAALEGEYQRARSAERTAQSYVEWRADAVTQTAAAWVLSCVFVRFLEDNRLIDPPKIAGPGERLRRARDEHELYFRAHPVETDREYLLQVFDALAKWSGTADLFGEHNPIHELPNWLSGDAAGDLLTFLQRIDANTGALVHDFTDSAWDTRFLGDLYQDLSESARKKYALLQTPEFVESFILDRTLDPALDAFGLRAGPDPFRLLDPTCGSGHFLLGAFQRILHRWVSQEPGTAARELVQRTLDAVCGVDINPFAVAIARFRLLVAALQASGIRTLRDAPGFRINVVSGDSLLHGRRFDELPLQGESVDLRRVGGIDHVYHAEDLVELNRILGRQYHVVVGNPPYITVKDKALNQAYRNRYSTCHQKYSLGVPFTQRFFELAIEGQELQFAGYVGMITANSFMKREFGKKLIEEFLPRIDLTHVIDTSGVYIPGHGTPTVILLGRNRPPLMNRIRTVMGVKGEPSTPDEPAQGLVWTSICDQLDSVGAENEFVSVLDIDRHTFEQHPWSLGGGGAAELKEFIEDKCANNIVHISDSVGISAVTGEDSLFLLSSHDIAKRLKIEFTRPMVIGELIRDWTCNVEVAAWLYDYDFQLIGLKSLPNTLRYFWPFRAAISSRRRFGTPMIERGLSWYEYQELYATKLRTPLSIAFAFVATHNHFVLDRGGKVFNRSAPIIKLPSDATEDDHLALLGLLNSSTACFWMKQVFHNKGATSDKGVLQSDPEKFRYEFDGSKLARFPIPALDLSQREMVVRLTSCLDRIGRELSEFTFKKFISTCLKNSEDLQFCLTNICAERSNLRNQMVRWQEELDWLCYELYGLLSHDSPDRSLIWSIKCDSMPPALADDRLYRLIDSEEKELPLGSLEQARRNTVNTNAEIRLIERPEYKRRWFRSAGAYDDTNLNDDILIHRDMRDWLLDRLERYFDIDGRMNDAGTPTAAIDIALVSTARLADIARQDDDFLQVGALYRDDPAFDVDRLVSGLVESESVPLLPILRYKAEGLSKRAAWEQTWNLQRLEDKLLEEELLDFSSWNLDEEKRSAIAKWQQTTTPHLSTENEALSTQNKELSKILAIPVPPKYKSSDFQNSTYWRLRGKLDVPKERWVSFPHCEGEDGALVIAWAGYDHLQLARAISAYYVDIQERLGGSDDPRLVPLLAGLMELLPWLKQWHNDVDPEFGMQMGDYFEGFIQEEARQMGKTIDEIKAWEPIKKTVRRRKKRA